MAMLSDSKAHELLKFVSRRIIQYWISSFMKKFKYREWILYLLRKLVISLSDLNVAINGKVIDLINSA